MPLDSAQLTSLHALLAHWDLPPVTAIEALDDGERVFKLTTGDAAFLLKDISAAPNLTRLEFTRAVLAHVAQSGLKVPVPLPSRDGHNAVLAGERYYLLAEFIEAGEYPRDPQLLGELFDHAGQGIARLHAALAAYPDPDVARQTWREDLAGQVPHWLTALSAGLPEPQAVGVRQIAEARGATIAEALRGLPEQLIHRDCHPGNVLVQGTQVVGFIDCDHLCIGPRVFDLAYYAVHHLKWQTGDEAATARWLANLPRLLEGYRAQGNLSAAEAAGLPAAMLAYHLLLSQWFLKHGQLAGIDLELRALTWLHTRADDLQRVVTAA